MLLLSPTLKRWGTFGQHVSSSQNAPLWATAVFLPPSEPNSARALSVHSFSMGVLPEPCAHRARTVRTPCVLLRILCPPDPQCLNLSCPGLSPDCLCTTTAPTGDRVSAIVIGPSPRGGRRISIRYELGGEEVLYEHSPEERLEFAIVTAESPDSPQPVHHEAPMDALLEPQLPEVEAEAPRTDDHEPECCGG